MSDVKEEPTGLWSRFMCHFGSAANKRAELGFAVWTLGWALTFVGASWLLTGNNPPARALAWTVALIPTAVGIGVVLAFMRYLRGADELMRRIQLEALGIGFGGGLLSIFGYQLLEEVGAPVLRSPDVPMVFIAFWVAGQLFSTWRYR